MTEPPQDTRGRIEHLQHRERDLLAKLELANERLAFFPNRMAKRRVATLSAEHRELTYELDALSQLLDEPPPVV